MKTASPSTPTTASRTPSTRPSSCAGSRDFDTADDYAELRPADGGETQSPGTGEAGAGVALPGLTCRQPRCRNTSTTSPRCACGASIQVAGHSYSVPSRAHRQGGADPSVRRTGWWEVYYKGHLVERMERVTWRGVIEANVNYRHPSLGPPGAQARSLRPLPSFREQLSPSMH